MFTGIIEERGQVSAVDPVSGAIRLVVQCRTVGSDASVGASIAVNGVCLTVAAATDGGLAFDVIAETLERSSLGRLRPGDPVNLERPLTLASRLGGHLVQGHVDGVGTVETLGRTDDGVVMRIRPPEELRRYIAEKGSIAVDGVSLTVASVDEGSFSVALVPHTMAVTTLGDREPGDPVNLEVDVLAKYVERAVGRLR
jgi:riboflavin synthase